MKQYDIVIVGGGTSGVSCAWNAAKLGLKVLIIEQNSFLGGSITSSLVIPAMKTSDNAINTDFFYELYNKLKQINGAITYFDGNRGWFNPELTKIALDLLMQDVNVDILFESTVTNVNKEKNKILSLCIESIYDNNSTMAIREKLSECIETMFVVDATGDGNFCKKINAKFLENNLEENQPNSLRFIMSGVNTKEFSGWLMNYDTDRNVSTSCIVEDNIYLSTAYTWDTNAKWALKPLFEKAIEEKVLTKEDSNYFQMFSVAGTIDSIAFNAPRIINNTLSRSESYIQARQSILRLSEFCKKYLPGFKKSYISNIANTLGVRHSNRVKGKYIYTYADLISGKKFEHPVLISNYPIDIHSSSQNNSCLEKVNIEYQLPIESLTVEEFENVFVIGRCISVDFKTQGALRIIPSCFSMGEGLAKYLANKV